MGKTFLKTAALLLIYFFAGYDVNSIGFQEDEDILKDILIPRPVAVGHEAEEHRQTTAPLHRLSKQSIKFISKQKKLDDTIIDFSLKKIFGEPVAAKVEEKCIRCHNGIEVISKEHDFPCTACHDGNPGSVNMSEAHKNMTANPSDLSTADRFCGECHKDHVERVKGSIMSTAAGEINITRYQWGAQKSADAVFGALDSETLKKIPAYNESNSPVDDMLRKKCLRCHINSVSPNRKGEYRSTGCAACHMIYSNDGKSRSPDMAIQKIQNGLIRKDQSGMREKRGYPIRHVLTTAIPSIQCVRCHSGNRAGTEYIGMFEHDSGIEYNPPALKSGMPDTIYGSLQHNLLPDIHHEKGLHCIDCHPQLELEGDGKVYSSKHYSVKIRCEDCHGTPEKPPSYVYIYNNNELKAANSNPNYSLQVGDKVVAATGGVKLGNVKKIGDALILTSKVTGKKHTVPLLINIKSQPVSHRISAHIKRIECHTCHSAWTSYNWGYNMIRESAAYYSKWTNWWFTDPVVQNILFRYTGTARYQIMPSKIEGDSKNRVKPEMLDWLTARQVKKGITGKKTLGVWWDFFTGKNWEGLIGMINSRGKISAAKPGHQWIVTVNGKKRIVKKDTYLQPYVPHTQRKEARMCEECHKNGYFVGKGRLRQSASIYGVRFFNEKEIDKLLTTSKRYKFFRYLDLKEKGWERLLK